MEALTSIEKGKGFVKEEDLRYYKEFNSSPDMPLNPRTYSTSPQ
jgi:hypothetical protein